MRVGLPFYLNALPFVASFQKHCELELASPSDLASSLQKNTIDLALTSSYLLTNPDYKQIFSYCISAEKQVNSVFLFHKIPILELSGKKIGLTSESLTSAMLTKILCKFHWHIAPEFHTQKYPEEFPAFLLIGDRALQANFSGYQSFDLCQGWYELTKLPFVFALFIQKKEKNIPYVEKIQDLSIEINDSLVEYAANKSGIALKTLKEYYQKLNYFFGKREHQALDLFLELAKQC